VGRSGFLENTGAFSPGKRSATSRYPSIGWNCAASRGHKDQALWRIRAGQVRRRRVNANFASELPLNGPRSDRAASHVVTDHFGAECVALVADPSFYHLDTAFCALPSGDVIYYPGAFTASARHAIEERVGPSQCIALDHAEAAQFTANAVSLDHCLVLSACNHPSLFRG
jgi:hypothetical protein